MSLRRQLEDHYGTKRLPPGRVNELTALVRGPAPARPVPAARRWAILGLAACLLIAAFLAGRGEDPATAVAREIALNHGKELEPEFRSGSWAELRGRMGKLDFPLLEPAGFADRPLRLVGARYCSLAGRIAAQVRLEDERGSLVTLYEVQDREAFDGVVDRQTVVDGVKIRIWREDGLLLGLATAPR